MQCFLNPFRRSLTIETYFSILPTACFITTQHCFILEVFLACFCCIKIIFFNIANNTPYDGMTSKSQGYFPMHFSTWVLLIHFVSGWMEFFFFSLYFQMLTLETGFIHSLPFQHLIYISVLGAAFHRTE